MNTWTLVEATFDPERQLEQETIFTIGNGYLGTRGSFEEGYPGDRAATFVHGIYDDAPIVHTELVNAPNWLDLIIKIDGERFRMDRGEVLGYQRVLDLRCGVLTRQVTWRSPKGRTIEFLFERFASLAQPHVMCVRCQVTSVDYRGPIEIDVGISGMVDNAGLRHWRWIDQGGNVDGPSMYLTVRTDATNLTLATAASLQVSAVGDIGYSYEDCPWYPRVIAPCTIEPGKTIVATKTVTIFTSRDTETPTQAAREALGSAVAQGYAALREAHSAAWDAVWSASNVVIEGDEAADLAVRFSLFQLLIAAPRSDEQVSIPAKTLSGFGYRGHIFWDTEIFMLPFFIYTQPEIARRMLMYRYWTLPGARRKAASQGCEGAMYAWESAATGDETTPRWVPVWVEERGTDELVRIWCGDIELHITADIAYAVMLYWRVTGDDVFMSDYGAEVVLDTAKFWASRATWSAERNGYEIRDVIGPDENHEHVNNNAYTNEMARWNIMAAFEVLEWLKAHSPRRAEALLASLDLDAARLTRWQAVVDGLIVHQDPDTRVIEQFDGFLQLKEVNLQAYEPRKTSMQALLGIGETNQTQILKQPDVLMLCYLLPERYDQTTVEANWNFYTPRTDLSYGSSLGPPIQAALAARLGDVAQAYRYFQLASRTDLQNARGNTADGIHGATAGGLWQAVIFGFAGIRIMDDRLVATPHLPASWKRLAFRLQYRGQWYDFDLEPSKR